MTSTNPSAVGRGGSSTPIELIFLQASQAPLWEGRPVGWIVDPTRAVPEGL